MLWLFANTFSRLNLGWASVSTVVDARVVERIQRKLLRLIFR